MTEKREKTSVLPPSAAVQIVWALTGDFSNDTKSQENAMVAETRLKEIIRKEKEKGGKDSEYILSITPMLDASRRSLEIVHKGRQLNFKDSETLRLSSLGAIKASLEFGTKTEDFLKALPTMTLAGSGGAIAIAELVDLSKASLWLVGLLFAAVGYFINLWIVSKSRTQKQQHYITQDYERSLYFEQYMSRVTIILSALYVELDSVHNDVFGSYFGSDDGKGFVKSLLLGVTPEYCKYIHEHIRDKKVTIDEWAICEAGSLKARETCPFWEQK